MKFRITICLALLSVLLNAQNFNPKTISLPENVTVDDLSFLKEELKDVQVVMLGELDHHDGNVFEMKTKVVKYLYQEMGYKTIAFESGVYDVWKAQQAINSGVEPKTAFMKSLHGIWSRTNEFQSFVEFYDNNKADLKLYGFDNQMTGAYSELELVNELYQYCIVNNLKFGLDQGDFSLLIEGLERGFFDEEDISYSEFQKTLISLLNQIKKEPKNEEQFYWRQTIKSILSLAEQAHSEEDPILSSFATNQEDNRRDAQMAENLLTYIKKHPNEKIICWGANAHFINDMSSVTTPIAKDFIPMGTYVKKALKEKVYSLATVTAADSIHMQGTWHRTPIKKVSFENHLKETELPYLFISSNQPEMSKVISNRLLSPITFIESRLDLFHDGYIFLKKDKQSTFLHNTEDYNWDESTSLHNKELKVKTSNDTTLDNKNIKIGMVALNEVVVYGKRATNQIVKKAIDRLKDNYPNSAVSSTHYTNLCATIDSIKCLDLDFIAHQYDKDYFNSFRCSKQLQEVRWRVKNGYEPIELRNFGSLRYNNPIKNGAFLKKRKYKKFKFELEEVKIYNGKEVYVINYSTSRNHWAYTKSPWLSDFSGVLFINKDDFAIVKVIQDWKYKVGQEEPLPYPYIEEGFAIYNKARECTYQRIETDFEYYNGIYYLSHSLIYIEFNLMDKKKKKSHVFSRTIDSYWSDFNIENPEKIKYKNEQNLFGKIKYNKEFWDNYSFPNGE